MKKVLLLTILITILISCEKMTPLEKMERVDKIMGEYDNSYYTFCSDWDNKTKKFVIGFAYYSTDYKKIKVVTFDREELIMLTNNTNNAYRNMSKRLLELYEGAIRRKMLDLFKTIP